MLYILKFKARVWLEVGYLIFSLKDKGILFFLKLAVIIHYASAKLEGSFTIRVQHSHFADGNSD